MAWIKAVKSLWSFICMHLFLNWNIMQFCMKWTWVVISALERANDKRTLSTDIYLQTVKTSFSHFLLFFKCSIRKSIKLSKAWNVLLTHKTWVFFHLYGSYLFEVFVKIWHVKRKSPYLICNCNCNSHASIQPSVKSTGPNESAIRLIFLFFEFLKWDIVNQLFLLIGEVCYFMETLGVIYHSLPRYMCSITYVSLVSLNVFIYFLYLIYIFIPIFIAIFKFWVLSFLSFLLLFLFIYSQYETTILFLRKESMNQ